MKDNVLFPGDDYKKYAELIEKSQKKYAKEVVKLIKKVPRKNRQWALFDAADCLINILDEIIIDSIKK